MRSGSIRFGTSSFSTKGWVGTFYPSGTAPSDFLRYYSTQFGCVEVDATYYAVPEERTVLGWAEKLPDGFTMCAKFPRSIVHGGEGPRPDPSRVLVVPEIEDDVDLFLRNMQRMGPKLGPLLLQFPYFNREAFSGPGPFLDRLAEFLELLPKGFRYAVEIRNKYWIRPPLLDLLRDHGVAFVLVDIAYMPHPLRVAERYDILTADFTYCRLIGDRKAVDDKTSTFDRIVVDRSTQLTRWRELLQSLRPRISEGFVFANNHFAGHAPTTLTELHTMVERTGP